MVTILPPEFHPRIFSYDALVVSPGALHLLVRTEDNQIRQAGDLMNSESHDFWRKATDMANALFDAFVTLEKKVEWYLPIQTGMTGMNGLQNSLRINIHRKSGSPHYKRFVAAQLKLAEYAMREHTRMPVGVERAKARSQLRKDAGNVEYGCGLSSICMGYELLFAGRERVGVVNSAATTRELFQKSNLNSRLTLHVNMYAKPFDPSI